MDFRGESRKGSLAEDLGVIEARAIMAIAASEAGVVPPFHHEGRVHGEIAAFAMADDDEWEKVMPDDLGDVILRKLLGRDLLHGREVAVFLPTDKASVGASEDDVSHWALADEGHRHVLDAIIDAEMRFDMPDLQRGEAGALQNLEPELVIFDRIARAVRKQSLIGEVGELTELDILVASA